MISLFLAKFLAKKDLQQKGEKTRLNRKWKRKLCIVAERVVLGTEFAKVDHAFSYNEKLNMKLKNTRTNRPNFYELALLMADGQARHPENGDTSWESFIDNLSRIADEFATQIHTKEKLWSKLPRSEYDAAFQV